MCGGENGSAYTFSDVSNVEVFMGKGGANNLTCDPITPR